jgi:hypothetical protein
MLCKPTSQGLLGQALTQVLRFPFLGINEPIFLGQTTVELANSVMTLILHHEFIQFKDSTLGN